MTREDAVTTLKDISEMVHKQKEIEKSTLYGILDSNNEPIEALDMAIKVLEQEPCDKCVYSTKDGCQYDDISETIPPFEPCDCISRAEAQKHIYRRLWESALNNDGYECKAEDVFMDIADNRLSTWISELPSIQPKTDMWSIKDVKDCFIKHGLITEQEPKTGHWIDSGIYGEIDGQITKAYTCSKCGAISIFRVSDGYIINADNCPNCGAKMESEGI